MREIYKNIIKCLCVGNNRNCKCMYKECNKCRSCTILIQNEFDAFINARYKKSEDGKELTHTSMGLAKGAWSISKEDYPTFQKLYKRFSRKHISALVERSPRIAPFYFDVDFHIKKNNRYYDDQFIKITIKLLNKIIGENFIIPENSNVLHSYLFEKSDPSEHNDGGYKDGFHIMYPELPLTTESRYYILDKFMECVKNDNYVTSKIPYTNELDEIFDKSVIIDNGVLMYGAAKDGREPYKLTKVYNENAKQILPELFDMGIDTDDLTSIDSRTTICKYNGEIMEWDDIIDLTSMRQYENEEEKIIKPATKTIENNIIDNYKQNHDKNTKKKKKKNIDDLNSQCSENDEDDNEENNTYQKNKDGITDKDIQLARELVKILSQKRASKYESWRDVGWALHNIDKNLYDAFLTFSKKAGAKYDEKSCYLLWKKAKTDGYSIGSLRKWAMEDDMDEFIDAINRINRDTLEKTLSGSHDDVAEYMYEFFKGKYVCADIDSKEWYVFKGNRWHIDKKGSSLFEKMSKEFLNIIYKALNILRDTTKKMNNIKANDDAFKEIEMNNELIRKNSELINKLKNIPYKKNIMEACSHKFYDSKFKDKLDANIYLMGFENGVYNFKEGELGFRSGVPEDYISFSVGYNYISKSDKTYQEKIKEFFKTCLPNQNISKYVTRFLASCLAGTSKDQKFPFWIGSGGNGKSVAVNMAHYAFGEYFGSLSPAYLTKKRGDSGGASPDLIFIKGKRIVAFQETEEGETIQVSKLKELCGNDTMSARALYAEQTQFTPQAKYILGTNKLPELKVDGGVKRRIRVVSWDMKFVDPDDFDPTNPKHILKDPELDDKIKSDEWKQNFMWFLINEIYPQYLAEGLCEPEEVKNLSGKYMASNDRIGMFVRICTEPFDGRTNLYVFYEEFKDFFKQRYNNEKPPNLEKLIEYLRNNDYKVEEKSKSNIYLYNLKIKNDDDDGDA